MSETETCTLCPEVFPGRYELVRHKLKAHRPVPGQVFFVKAVMRTYINTGSGTHLWALCDDEGTIAMVHELPDEPAFIEVKLAGSRIGAGTPVVAAYDPATVRWIGDPPANVSVMLAAERRAGLFKASGA